MSSWSKGEMDKIPDDVQRWRDCGNTLPVARDLAFLDSIGILKRVEGHSRGMSLFPFSVRLADGSYHGHPAELHETTQRWRERYEKGDYSQNGNSYL